MGAELENNARQPPDNGIRGRIAYLLDNGIDHRMALEGLMFARARLDDGGLEVETAECYATIVDRLSYYLEAPMESLSCEEQGWRRWLLAVCQATIEGMLALQARERSASPRSPASPRPSTTEI